MKILYHHRTQGRGAEGVHIVSIVKAFESMGHKVTLLSPPGIDPLTTAGNAPVDKSSVKTHGINSLWKFISKNLPNFVFELIEIFYNVPAYFRLRRALSQDQYDFIYERYAFYMVVDGVIAKRHGVPFVLEANEVNGIMDRARKQSFERLCAVFEKMLFVRCAAIHTVSSSLKSMILCYEDVDHEKVFVTPNAIDLGRFSRGFDNKELRSQLSLKGKTVIGFAGWFDDWDRLDLLLDVYLRLKAGCPELALLLVGDGDVLRPVEARILLEKIPDVVLTGAVPRAEVHRYLSLLDVAVITHSNDFGSPVVMFEFMGLEIPIVAPKLMPITDVLEDNVDGILFETLNMKQCEEMILKLIKSVDLRRQISANAYAKLIKNHTWESNARAIIDSSGLTRA